MQYRTEINKAELHKKDVQCFTIIYFDNSRMEVLPDGAK